jgi:dTDP-glucose 4,6-dehydratase
LSNLKDIESSPNYTFIKADIVDLKELNRVFEQYKFTDVIHLAAESHVDRSIAEPLAFVYTNVIGTVNLLNSFRSLWKDNPEGHLFYHISTDEVYGSLHNGGFFTEETPYDPQSPYSASKASSDHFVRAYHNTYKIPVVISNCSNNYGPNQYPEKLIPVAIQKIIKKLPIPVYGQGINVRDWLFVLDHARAIDEIFHKGKSGSTYNIGGFNEWKNIDLIRLLCKIMDSKLNRVEGESEKLISFVTDRQGHDLRYAIDATKLNKELGWYPSVQFEEGLTLTVEWYLKNEDWMNEILNNTH